ncbi:MAG TPA: transketolase [Bryobacteraceae bacterium]|nr:transketolase [Bryobacteraceae bacterium]
MGVLEDQATRLRIDSIRATTAAGSGHPTTCGSAAEIVSVLFFSVMRYDPADPGSPRNDKFILSKGHGAPLLYAVWAEAGAFPRDQLLTLRRIDSDLEGHPTPRLPFVDVATGSLGQGLPVAVGMALGAQLDGSDQRIYVLMGDGESAEGSVWEAAQVAPVHKLGNLCAIIDINRLGQSEPTILQHDLPSYKRRWEAFGWNALTVDGHDIPALLNVFEKATQVTDKPTIVLACTYKGHGMLDAEDREGYHGKPFEKEVADKIVAALEAKFDGKAVAWSPKLPSGTANKTAPARNGSPQPPYQLGGKEIATRKAFGDALAALGRADSRIVALDGDVKNSTYSEEFQKAAPERFFQGYIAEQNMVGMAMGLSATGRIPFAATFGCFLSRAADFIRMAAISGNNIKLAGTHAGISIGEDGPSQMALEDLALIGAEPNFTVLYPSDATSAWRATELAAGVNGPCYLRLGRPNAKVLYGPDEKFSIGKCKVLRESPDDRAVVVAAGVTLFEALAAYDELKKAGLAIRVIDLFSMQPIDRDTLIAAARAAKGNVITVEDHYAHGGIGDAVAAALSAERFLVEKLAVREIPRSGKPKELLDRFGISARHIVEAVRAL